MSDTPDSTDVSRRSVLRKAALTSGAALFGGASIASNAAGAETNFAYVPNSHVEGGGTGGSEPEDAETSGGTVTLDTRVGRARINCNDAGAKIKTTEFKVSGKATDWGSESWFFIPNSYRVGDEVKISSNAVNCTGEDDALTEVGVTKVE